MLKRSKLLVAFLVVTVLCASIGFAAVSDQLNVGGSLAINADDFQTEFDADVYFVQDTITNSDETNVTVTPSNENDTLTIAIAADAWNMIGSTVTVTAKVKNAGSYAVELTDFTVTTTAIDSWITSTITLNAADENVELAAGDEATLSISFELTSMPANNVNETNAFTVTFNAAPAQ